MVIYLKRHILLCGWNHCHIYRPWTGFLWTWGCKCFLLEARELFSWSTYSCPFWEGSGRTSSTNSRWRNGWTSDGVLRSFEKYVYFIFECINVFQLKYLLFISIFIFMLIILNTLLAVAKALRRAAEGKASAQAEAAEWKRRYELERARNIQMGRKGFWD